MSDSKMSNLPAQPEPSTGDIRHFVLTVQRLSNFEAQQHMVRGHGVFDRAKADLPDPAAVRVLNWLTWKAS